MRKFTVLEFITMDGIIQGPGSPTEDKSGGFKLGGWVAPYDDEIGSKMIRKLLKPSDLLLGRKTFQIWEKYWPAHAENWPGVNEVNKYVLSTTRKSSQWENSVFLVNLAGIKKMKQSPGRDIKIWGSSEVVQLLLKHDLVDDMWLMIHPLILGKGKKLFDPSSVPSSFTLNESKTTSTGVIIAHFVRAGKIKTGTISS